MRIFPVAGWLIISLLVLAPVSWAAESDVDRLLNLLVEKGVVSKEDAANFRADLAVTKQEEKEKQKEFTILAGKPIKVSGYIQPRYQYQEERGKSDSFDVRRARLDIKGDITERFGYRTQVEFGGTSGPFLLDATIDYKFNPYLKLTAGQFKIPFSQENLTSSPKLETINRSQVVEALVARSRDVIGNQNGRDIGVQASGSLLPYKEIYLFDYAVGVFNGSGINKVEVNEQKDLIGRLIFHPLTKDLSIGGSYYTGRFTLTTARARVDDNKRKRDRFGTEFAYVKDPVSLKGEYIWGIDGWTNKQGGYIQAGYFIIPKKFQGVFKFDTFDPNADTDDDETFVYTIGGNWYFNKWAFLQVNYEIKDERNPNVKEIKNNALTAQATLQF